MDVKEFDELINALPKVKIDEPISSMNSINIEDLRNAVERLKKIPTYQDLLKENQELKKQLDKMEQIQCNFLGTGCKRKIEEYEVQQKEFINYLKSMLENEKDNFSVARVKDVLLKYKEIIGVKDER